MAEVSKKNWMTIKELIALTIHLVIPLAQIILNFIAERRRNHITRVMWFLLRQNI
jgi:hypothetical protein